MLIEQNRQTPLPRLKARNIAGHETFDKRRNFIMCARLPQPLFEEKEARPHVRDIEEARLLARPEVFRLHALKLDRHFIARKRDDLAAKFNVQIVKRGAP